MLGQGANPITEIPTPRLGLDLKWERQNTTGSAVGGDTAHLANFSGLYSTPIAIPVSINVILVRQDHLIEYPRASMQAENARLKMSMPCWYVAFACVSSCCCCCAVACAACCLAALLARLCFAPPTIVPAAAPAAAPLPASSSAIAPTAAPPAAPLAAPLTRPPFACLTLSAAACCSALFCSSVLVAGGGACGSIPDCCLAEVKHSFSSFNC